MVSLGEIPSREYLYNASENNPHGYGFAVNHGDRIVTGRSMKYERLIERFITEMGQSENPTGMYHARYSTHGTTTLENNHPFRVDGRKDIVLGHNGMLPITPRAGDNRSDTRIFAEETLGSIGIEQLDDKDGFRRLEQFTAGSKVAILTNAPELRDSVYILNEDDGHWDKGIWWSNTGYKNSYGYSNYGYGGSLWAGSNSQSKYWWNDTDDDYITSNATEVKELSTTDCTTCGNLMIDEEIMYGICNVCNTCIDCQEHAVTCMCYNVVDKHGNYNVNHDIKQITQHLGY
jgi:hypothetical protein